MIEDELRRVLNSPERTLPMWQDPVSRVRAGMRRRLRRIAVSAAAVVLVGTAGTAFVLTRDSQTQPALADGAVVWIDSPAAVETSKALPLLEPAGLEPCQQADLAQIDSQNVVVEGPPQTVGYGLRVQNIGAHSCVLVGRPVVRRLDREGSAIGTPAEPGAFAGSSGDGAESIALRPGHSGIAWLSFPSTPDCEVSTGEVGSNELTANGKAFKLRHGAQMMTCPLKISGWHSDLSGPFSGLRAEISGGSVKQGKEYTYFVNVTNITKVDVPLTPCPVYTQQLAPANLDVESDPITSSHRLHCDRPAIRAGETIRYQMRLQIGPDVPLGSWTLAWSILDGPNAVNPTAVRPY